MILSDYKKDDSEKATEKNKKWLLLCATKPEWSELKKYIIPSPFTLPLIPSPQGRGDNFWLYQIGIGSERARSMAPPLLESLKSEIQGVIHFGLAGALQENMKEGDFILPTQITAISGETVSPCPKLLAQAEDILLNDFHFSFTAGKLLTAEKVLETPEEKRETGKKWNAVAVDMESFPYAKACAERNIPYVSIRAIFDPLEWNLQILGSSSANFMREDGNINTGFILKEMVKKPRLLMTLPHYQSAANKGNKTLARFLWEMIKYT